MKSGKIQARHMTKLQHLIFRIISRPFFFLVKQLLRQEEVAHLLLQWQYATAIPSSLAELAGFARQHGAAPGAASPAGELLPIPSTPALPLAAGCPSCSAPPSSASQSGQLFLLSLCPLGLFLSETSIKTNKTICKINVLGLLSACFKIPLFLSIRCPKKLLILLDSPFPSVALSLQTYRRHYFQITFFTWFLSYPKGSNPALTHSSTEINGPLGPLMGSSLDLFLIFPLLLSWPSYYLISTPDRSVLFFRISLICIVTDQFSLSKVSVGSQKNHRPWQSVKMMPAAEYSTLQPTATRGRAWEEKWEQGDNGHEHVIARSLMGRRVKRQFVFCFFPPLYYNVP